MKQLTTFLFRYFCRFLFFFFLVQAWTCVYHGLGLDLYFYAFFGSFFGPYFTVLFGV